MGDVAKIFDPVQFLKSFMAWLKSDSFRAACTGKVRRNLMETAFYLKRNVLNDLRKPGGAVNLGDSDVSDTEVKSESGGVPDNQVLNDAEYKKLLAFVSIFEKYLPLHDCPFKQEIVARSMLMAALAPVQLFNI